MMKDFFEIGVSKDFPDFINERIRLSNRVAILMSLVGLCYTVFSIIFYPTLVVYPVFCIIFSFGAVFLNYLGQHQMARFFLSTLVILLAFVYHAFLVQPGEDLIISMMVIEFALSVIPWILIDLRERILLIASVSTCYVLIFIQPVANELFAMELDSALFRSGFLHYASYAFAILILVVCLYFVMKKNLESNLNNQQLLQDIQARSEEMERQKNELIATLEQNKEAAREEERRNWIATGVSELSSIMRGDLDSKLYRELISAIVKFMKINQAGIYVVEEDELDSEKYIELKSCYAFDRLKFQEKRIEVGQGLIGQCYLEKDKIFLKKVPDAYLNIRSGLGDGAAKSVLIVPMIYEDKVEGILELASFQQLEEYQIEFIERLSETLASYISSNKINARTKSLLQRSQQQSEELRAQEEEMRQNMEELQATQEEVSRKEEDYLRRIAELEEKLDMVPNVS